MGRQARHQEPRLQRPDPGPRREEVRHGLGRPLGDARSAGSRSASAGRTCRTRRSSRPRRATRRRRRSRPGTRPTRRSRRSRARRPSSSCRRRSRTRRRRRSRTRTPAFLEVATGRASGIVGRELPARAVQQVEREQAARRSPFPKPLHVEYGSYGVQKGNAALARVPEQVHLHGAEERSARRRSTRRRSARRCRRCRPASSTSRAWPAALPPATQRSNRLDVRMSLVRRPRRSAAARPGSPPRSRRPARGSRSRSSTSGRRFGGQIFKQPGPGFRVTRRARRSDATSRAAALLIERPSAAAHDCCRARAPSRSDGTSVVLVEEGEHARTVAARRIARRGRRARPPGRLPGLDAPGRDHRRRRADARQDAARPARPARSSSPAAAPLALAFPAQLRGVRRERRRSCSRRGRAPAPRRVVRLAARRTRATLDLLRDAAALPIARSCATACRSATGGSSCAPRATGGWSSVVHAAADADWRPRRRAAEETVAADTLCVGYGFFPRSSCCGSPAARSPTTRISAGPVVVRGRVAAHQQSAASRRRATARASHGSYVADRRGSPRGARRGRSTSAPSPRRTRPAGAPPIRRAASRSKAGVSQRAARLLRRRAGHLRARDGRTRSSAAARS